VWRKRRRWECQSAVGHEGLGGYQCDEKEGTEHWHRGGDLGGGAARCVVNGSKTVACEVREERWLTFLRISPASASWRLLLPH